MVKKIFLVIFCSVVLIACNNKTIEDPKMKVFTTANPTVEEVLSEEQNADIFIYGETVYKNAESISWVTELDLQVGEVVSEIKVQSKDPKDFEDGSAATKLPIGTKIYKPIKQHGPVLIVLVNGKEVRYVGLVEG